VEITADVLQTRIASILVYCVLRTNVFPMVDAYPIVIPVRMRLFSAMMIPVHIAIQKHIVVEFLAMGHARVVIIAPVVVLFVICKIEDVKNPFQIVAFSLVNPATPL